MAALTLRAATTSSGSGAPAYRLARRGLKVTLKGLSDPAAALIDWGDGTAPDRQPAAAPSHTYQQEGTYTVCVENPAGLRACHAVTVQKAGNRRTPRAPKGPARQRTT